MKYSKSEIMIPFDEWLFAWNEHSLDGVMNLLHEDIVFENWTGATIVGKKLLKKLWTPWFLEHGNFKFIKEDVFFDESEQKMLFMWQLEWPSFLTPYKGENEIRRGVDILYFEDGKIIRKYTYTKTTVHIEGVPVSI